MISRKKREMLFHFPIHLILIPIALLMALPFVLMCATSFKEAGDIFTYPPRILGKVFTWENYSWLFNKVPFTQYFMNSLKITIIVTVGQLFTSSLAGYVFAKLKFKGRDKLFFVYLATLMVPGHVTLIPNFIIFKFMGLIDTHMSLILPALATAFGTFLMRQFFVTIPDDLSEAAKIDGCSQFGIFSRIFLPLCKPALATLGIFTFNATWTDYLGPLVFLISPKKLTLTVGVAALQGTYATNWGVLMAGLTISVIPVLILFFAAQDFFVKGIVMTGMKA